MKTYFYLLIVLMFTCIACDDDSSLPTIKPLDEGTWTDPDTQEEYGWVRIGNQQWMTSNLKAGTPYYAIEYDLDKWEIYSTDISETEEGTEEERLDYKKFGNLYEWDRACEVCAALKDGWRLPSDEDWQELERAIGMSIDESASEGWRGDGVADLMCQGKEGSGLNLLIAGNASLTPFMARLAVQFVYEKGFYWSPTQDSNGKVYYRKLDCNLSTVFRTSIDPLTVPMMRVRCVRDVQ